TNPELDVKVIRLVRDGRATALTYMDPEQYADAQQAHLRGGGSGLSRERERLSVQAAAHEWRRSNEEAAAIVRRLPHHQWTQVRYEDLCRDPHGTLAALCTFIGVDGAPPIETFKTREHHVIGNGMRFDTSNTIAVDDRWRSALGAEHLRIFDHTAGALNRELGYA
ncbi:MAG TPA: sulfotransferase, partial [Vicinamibacterales bacterium]|nr:sulfotransferase [Vicinamibacterales bacterium]